MRVYISILFFCLMACACNNVNYTPRSKHNKMRMRPHISLYDKIADYRAEMGFWPASQSDMLLQGGKYKDAWDGYIYTETNFKIKDSVNMVFTYDGHPVDVYNQKNTDKIELNRYSGSVIFYKLNGLFTWKIK